MAYYNETTGELENEQLGDWDLIREDDVYTTNLTVTSHENYDPPGTYEVQFRRFVDVGQGWVEQGSPIFAGAFDLREIQVQNVRTKCPADPLEGPLHIAFDLVCLPPPSSLSVVPNQGWKPTSTIDWELTIIDSYDEDISPSPNTGTVTPQNPDASGKVASVEVLFEGKDSQNDFLTDDVLSRVKVLASVPGTGNVHDDNGDLAVVFHRVCGVECKQNEATHQESLSLGNSGLIGQIVLLYQGLSSCRQPTSLGYGWSSLGSGRITEPDTGVVVYRNEQGAVRRWEDDGNGNYIPVRADNHVELLKDTNSTTARYVLTFRDQTVLEFNSDGRLEARQDRNGNSVSYSYTGTLIDSVSDSKGHSVYFDYGTRTDGQPVEIRGGHPVTGRPVTLDYYSDTHPVSPDRLQRITDPSGLATEFEYDERGRMIRKTSVRPTRGDLVIEYTYSEASSRLRTENLYGKLETVHDHGYQLVLGAFAGFTETYPIVDDEYDEENARNRYISIDPRGRVESDAINLELGIPS